MSNLIGCPCFTVYCIASAVQEMEAGGRRRRLSWLHLDVVTSAASLPVFTITPPGGLTTDSGAQRNLAESIQHSLTVHSTTPTAAPRKFSFANLRRLSNTVRSEEV